MTTGNNGSVENYQPPAEGSAKCTTRNSGVVLAAGFSGNLQYYKTSPTSVQSPQFLDLPQEIIEKIFGYLKFKNICQLRLVSITFLLNYDVVILLKLCYIRLDFKSSYDSA